MIVLLPDPFGPANTRNLGTVIQSPNPDYLANSHLAFRFCRSQDLDRSIRAGGDKVGTFDANDRMPGRQSPDVSSVGCACCHLWDAGLKLFYRFVGKYAC